jgi:hypothetical protein
MKNLFIPILLLFASCQHSNTPGTTLQGTWQLVSGTIIEKGDTTTTDYTKGRQMIKVINPTHFAFLNHDLTHGKDSTALFVAGGGTYELKDNQYTEHLEYCSARTWEGHDFQFTIVIQNDTLTQSGVEKIEASGIDRINVEKYVRIRK